MELAEGGDLLQRIFDYKRNGNQFKEEYIWDIFIQVLKGLNALHELKITHRDIKVRIGRIRAPMSSLRRAASPNSAISTSPLFCARE